MKQAYIKQFQLLSANNRFFHYFAIPVEAISMLADFNQCYYDVENIGIAKKVEQYRQQFKDKPKENTAKIRALLEIQKRSYLLSRCRRGLSVNNVTANYQAWLSQLYDQESASEDVKSQDDFWQTLKASFSAEIKSDSIFDQLVEKNQTHIFASSSDLIAKFKLLASLEAILIGIVNYLLASLNKRKRISTLQEAHRYLVRWCEDNRFARFKKEIAILIHNIGFVYQERYSLVMVASDYLSASDKPSLLADTRPHLPRYVKQINQLITDANFALPDVVDSKISETDYRYLMRQCVQHASVIQRKKLNRFYNSRPYVRHAIHFRQFPNRDKQSDIKLVLFRPQQTILIPTLLRDSIVDVLPQSHAVTNLLGKLNQEDNIDVALALLDSLNVTMNKIDTHLSQQFSFKKLGLRYVLYFRRCQHIRQSLLRSLLESKIKAVIKSLDLSLKRYQQDCQHCYPYLPTFAADKYAALFNQIAGHPLCSDQDRDSLSYYKNKIKQYQYSDSLLKLLMTNNLVTPCQEISAVIKFPYSQIEQFIESVIKGNPLSPLLIDSVSNQLKQLSLPKGSQQDFINSLIVLVEKQGREWPLNLYDFAYQLGSDHIQQTIANLIDDFFAELDAHPSLASNSQESIASRLLVKLLGTFNDTPNCIKQLFIKRTNQFFADNKNDISKLASLKTLLLQYDVIPPIADLAKRAHASLMQASLTNQFQKPTADMVATSLKYIQSELESAQLTALPKRFARSLAVQFQLLQLKKSDQSVLTEPEQQQFAELEVYLKSYIDILKRQLAKANFFDPSQADCLIVFLGSLKSLATYYLPLAPLYTQYQNQIIDQIRLYKIATDLHGPQSVVVQHYCHHVTQLANAIGIQSLEKINTLFSNAGHGKFLAKFISDRKHYYANQFSTHHSSPHFFTAKNNVTTDNDYQQFLSNLIKQNPKFTTQIHLEQQIFQVIEKPIPNKTPVKQRCPASVCNFERRIWR